MTEDQRGSSSFPLCPRCGSRLHRERRHLLHRLLSVAYPVRYFGCSQKCGWRGLLPSVTGLERRRRQIRLVVTLLVLALGAGFVVWKYKSDIVWSPQHRAPEDGVEESGG